MQWLKSSLNKLKAENLESKALAYLAKKKYQRLFDLIPKWEDYEFLRIEQNPALIAIMLLDPDKVQDRAELLRLFSQLKYRTRAVNCEKNLFSLTPYQLAVVNNQLDLAREFET